MTDRIDFDEPEFTEAEYEHIIRESLRQMNDDSFDNLDIAMHAADLAAQENAAQRGAN